MDLTVFIGVVMGVWLLIQAVGLENSVEFFYQPPSMLIVIGGTFGACLVHFPLTQLFKVWGRLKVIFSIKKRNLQKDIEDLVRLSDVLKRDGRKALSAEVEKVKDHYIKTSLELIIDKVEGEQLSEIMNSNIAYMEERHEQGIIFFEQLAKYAPGFGLLGTLIGLIQLLQQLDDPASLGPNMATALVTTLYGVLLSNLLFTPLAGRLKISSYEERFQKEMLKEGIVSMSISEPGYIIREKMLMFLSEKEIKKKQKKESKGK